jgi:hypothetical protein
MSNYGIECSVLRFVNIPLNHTDCRESNMSSTDIRIRKKVVIVGDGACGKVQYSKVDTL